METSAQNYACAALLVKSATITQWAANLNMVQVLVVVR